MLKRILSLLLIAFMLSACTRDTRETVTFSSWGSVTEVKILKKVISDFEKENPDIKINFLHIPQNYFQKIHLLFASNTSPDVLFVNNLYLPIYADKLEDLSGIVNKDEFYKEGIQAFSVGGKLLAVPRDISEFVIYYNKDFVTREPKTFSELDSFIKKFRTKKRFGISYERDLFYAEPYILTMGKEEGIKYYKSLEGRYAPSPADAGSLTQAQMFLDKKLVFYISGRWMYPKLCESADFSFGIIPFRGKVYSDASGWAISKNTKHKTSAEKFVKYISSENSIKYFASTGLIVPSRKNVDFSDSKAFLEGLQNSVIRIPDKNYGKNRDLFNKKMFN